MDFRRGTWACRTRAPRTASPRARSRRVCGAVGAARGATAVVNVRAAANIVERSRRGVATTRARGIRSRVGFERSSSTVFRARFSRGSTVNVSECPNLRMRASVRWMLRDVRMARSAMDDCVATRTPRRRRARARAMALGAGALRRVALALASARDGSSASGRDARRRDRDERLPTHHRRATARARTRDDGARGRDRRVYRAWLARVCAMCLCAWLALGGRREGEERGRARGAARRFAAAADARREAPRTTVTRESRGTIDGEVGEGGEE